MDVRPRPVANGQREHQGKAEEGEESEVEPIGSGRPPGGMPAGRGDKLHHQADEDGRGALRDTPGAKRAVQLHVAGADQRRLHEQQDHPGDEHHAVQVHHRWRRRKTAL